MLALGGSTDELGREPKVASALMERLDDPDQLVRLRAAQALAFAPAPLNEAKAGLRGLVASLEATRPDARSGGGRNPRATRDPTPRGDSRPDSTAG